MAVADKPVKKPVVAKPKPAPRAIYVHTVTLPLKKDAPAGTAEKIIADCHKMLAKIPTVRGVKAGRPAQQNSKDYVKTDYAVGLLVLLDDYQGLKTYIDHPLHKAFVEKYKKHIDFDTLRSLRLCRW